MKYFFSIEEERAADFMLAASDVGIARMSSTTSDGVTTFVLSTSPAEAVRRMHEAYTDAKAESEIGQRDAT